MELTTEQWKQQKKKAEERLEYMLKRCDADGYCKYYTKEKGCDGCCEAVRIAVRGLEQEAQRRWIKITERVPEDDRYIMLSFANFSLPTIGRYEKDEQGGAFYDGDSDKSLNTYGLFVNAWMELPEQYREEEEDE